MIIYNVTSKVARAIHPKWIRWMEDVWLPQAMAESEATSYQLTRLLDVDNRQGPTYALLLTFTTRQKLVEYRSRVLPGLDKMTKKEWGDDVLSFGTTLDVVLHGQGGR